MGCGESKLDVVSGNTIFRRKKSNPNPKKSKDIQTIPETTSNTKDNTADSSAKEQQQLSAPQNEEYKDFSGAVPTDAKDSIHENTAAKEGDIDDEKRINDQVKEGGDDDDHVEEKEATGRLISHDSPNHYFSPRKNGEGIDGINVSEERRSIESDYYSPSHAAGKEDHLLSDQNVKVDGEAVEGNELAEDKELTKADQKDNGEPVKVQEEEKVNKDAERKTIDAETEVLSKPTSDQEKNYTIDSDNQDQENKIDTPTEDDEISKK